MAGQNGGEHLPSKMQDEPADSMDMNQYQIPPEARYRWRADGGKDELIRVNFVGALSPAEMMHIWDLLMSVVSESDLTLGYAALTKVEFIEPDTCEYRFWCTNNHMGRVARTWETWYHINRIHPIRNVDNIPYSWLGLS